MRHKRRTEFGSGLETARETMRAEAGGHVHWSSTTELAVTGWLLSRAQQLEVGRLEARVRALYEALSVVPLDERERRGALRSAILHTEERVKRLAKGR